MRVPGHTKSYEGTDFMYTKHTVPNIQLQDNASRTTRHSYHVAMQYALVNPDMRTRHGFPVDLARNLHRR
jgi:hypothetical protein